MFAVRNMTKALCACSFTSVLQQPRTAASTGWRRKLKSAEMPGAHLPFVYGLTVSWLKFGRTDRNYIWVVIHQPGCARARLFIWTVFLPKTTCWLDNAPRDILCTTASWCTNILMQICKATWHVEETSLLSLWHICHDIKNKLRV